MAGWVSARLTGPSQGLTEGPTGGGGGGGERRLLWGRCGSAFCLDRGNCNANRCLTSTSTGALQSSSESARSLKHISMGMNRQGFVADQINELLVILAKTPQLKVISVYTHLTT